ncbi:MAG: substrate-binding domain-containing protein [Candidatus Limnocylindrales bacterium]
MTHRQTGRGAIFILGATLAFAACGGGSSPRPSGTPGDSTTASSGTPSGAPLTGEITISGSSTVQPVTQGVAEAFNEVNPDVAISVDGPGTGDGFKLFCAGDTDISDASRPIKDTEKAACGAAGVDFIELKVAIDGMSILTSTKNSTGITCLSFADLYALVGPESEGVANWKDGQALATELGSTTTLPDAPLTIYGPGEESGTYDYFVEKVVTAWAKERTKDNATRKDYSSSPNDNVIIEGIAGDDTSLGWVGYAYAEENLDKVKLLQVSKPDGACVAPTADTIASGAYPLARDLYLYVNTGKAATNAALAAFVDFYLADGTVTAVNSNVGYINLAADALTASRAAWEAR